MRAFTVDLLTSGMPHMPTQGAYGQAARSSTPSTDGRGLALASASAASAAAHPLLAHGMPAEELLSALQGDEDGFGAGQRTIALLLLQVRVGGPSLAWAPPRPPCCAALDN